MTALLWAAIAILFVGGGVTLLAFWKSRQATRQALNRAAEREAELKRQRKSDSDLIAEMRRVAGFDQAEIMHLNARLIQAEVERDEARRQGALAAKASMNILARERDESVASIASWIFMYQAAVLAAVRTPAALPARSPQPPMPLPSGDWLVEPDLILQTEDV